MTDSGFHVYFWRLQIFRWTIYETDIFIKRTLLPLTNGVQFIDIPLWLLKRHGWVQPKILVLIIDFFSINFTNIETEGERVSSSQNKRTLRMGGGVGGWVCARKWTRANKGVWGVKSPKKNTREITWKSGSFCCITFPWMLHRYLLLSLQT